MSIKNGIGFCAVFFCLTALIKMCFLISMFLCFALVPKLVPRTVDFHWYWYRILKFWYRDNTTVCMNVQQESSPYSLPVTIATVTKVKSKLATCIKLKVLSLSDTTRVQSSRKIFRQIFINQQQLLYLGG